MKAKNWKTIAIIFIIIAIVEFLLFVWLMSLGSELIQQESECAYNICDGYDSFYFDDYEEVCYCYEDNEIAHQEFIG